LQNGWGYWTRLRMCLAGSLRPEVLARNLVDAAEVHAGKPQLAANEEQSLGGQMYFVPEGQHDSSQARSAWESVPRKDRPVGYGMIGRG